MRFRAPNFEAMPDLWFFSRPKNDRFVDVRVPNEPKNSSRPQSNLAEQKVTGTDGPPTTIGSVMSRLAMYIVMQLAGRPVLFATVQGRDSRV